MIQSLVRLTLRDQTTLRVSSNYGFARGLILIHVFDLRVLDANNPTFRDLGQE